MQDAATAQIKQTMDAAGARIRQLRKQAPLPDAAAAEIKQIQAGETASLGKIGNEANDRIELINSRIAEAMGEARQVASAAPAPAAASPPPPAATAALESLTVTAATPSAAAITSFILSHGAGTRLTGKLARWKMGICPRAEGLGPEDAAYVARRMRDVAASVGAPVNLDPACRANIRIVFTPSPEDFLDAVRKADRAAPGTAESLRQAARLSTLTRTVQAWYTTASEDARGRRELDTPRPVQGMTMEMPMYFPVGPGGGNAAATGTMTMVLPSATTKAVTGNRLDDGLSSDFDRILIVVEPTRLRGIEARSLADYVAVLGLSQPDAIDRCETLPSIVNLLVTGCAAPTTITDGDVAYLRGLYKMTATGSLPVQRGQLRYQMEQSLKRD